MTEESGYDAFISYSRRDADFARRFEAALDAYRPPRDLAVPQRRLRVFRDESDFSGVEYHASLERNLRASAKLIVLCSPAAAASAYVSDEIRRFAELHGSDHIIAVLVDGVPNNDAGPADADRKAFPEELLRRLPMPLASDYRGFSAKSDRLQKGRFAPAWFKLLADLYAEHGVDRGQVEQREQKRAARLRRIVASGVTGIITALSALAIWALLSRAEAIRQRNLALAGQYEVQSRLAFDETGEGWVRATLLAVASLRASPTVNGEISLMRMMGLAPRAPLWRQQLPHDGGSAATSEHARVLAFSPDGKLLAEADGASIVQILDAGSGRLLRTIAAARSAAGRTTLAFSPDGARLLVGCQLEACIVDPASGALLARLPRQGSMLWSAAYSPDGRRLATASYGANDAYLYDARSRQPLGTFAHAASSIFSVAFSPDGDVVAVAGGSTLSLWTGMAPDKALAQAGIGGLVWGMAFAPDGDLLATAGQGLELWRTRTAPGQSTLERVARKPLTLHSIAPVAGRDSVCFATGGHAIAILCGLALAEATIIPVATVAMTVSPDSRFVAGEDSAGNVVLWPLAAGGDVARVKLIGGIRALLQSAAPDWVAAATDSGTVHVLDAALWTERKQLPLGAPITMALMSPDGRNALFATGGTLHVIDVGTWSPATEIAFADDIAWLTFDASARWLIAMSGYGRIRVLSSADWHEALRVELEGSVQDIRVSPDGNRIATVTAPQFTRGIGLLRPTRTRVWDLSTAAEIASQYHEQQDVARGFYLPRDSTPRKLQPTQHVELAAQSLAWPAVALKQPDALISSDSAWSATPTAGGMQLTSLSESRVFDTLHHDGEVGAAIFVPARKPRWLVTGAIDGTLRVWPLTAGDMTTTTCARLRAVLSPEDWTRSLHELGERAACAR